MRLLLIFSSLLLVQALPRARQFMDRRVLYPAFASLGPKAGRPDALRRGRIVGPTADTAEPHSYPHQVGLFIDGGYFCGGQIITPEWVLTAAHCTDGAHSMEVVAGAHYIYNNEPEQQRVTSSVFITHENWNSQTLNNDIGLIDLRNWPLTFNAFVSSVAIAQSEPSLDDLYTVTGWGKPYDSAPGISVVLREVKNVTLVTNEYCSEVYGQELVTDNLICINSTLGGTCNGDSGGPLTTKAANGAFITHGITSFGATAGCEAGFPDGFTKVFHYLDWIISNTGAKTL